MKNMINEREQDFIIPLVGSARTLHLWMVEHEGEWNTINEMAEKSGLARNSVQASLTYVQFDPRVVRRKRPNPYGRSDDEYSFLSFLRRLR